MEPDSSPESPPALRPPARRRPGGLSPHWLALLCALATAVCFAPARARQAVHEPQPPEAEWRVSIPLQDGELQLGEVVGKLADEVGMDGQTLRRMCDYSVPVRTPVGSSTMRLISSITDGIVKFSVSGDEVALTVDRVRLRREQTQFNGYLRELIETFFPEAAAETKARFGVSIHLAGGSTQPLSAENAPKSAVVLIHGLDDPGRLWTALIPDLLAAGYGVCEVTYPNDQSIAESSAFVASLLEQMRAGGVERISIVAHSMGSLISRDLLTGADFYAGSSDGGERFPRIERLIMLGPPNHGSRMALLRIASEARDQVVRALSGDGLLIGGFFDGAGEAQDDLVPGSPFLTGLNARPLPAGLPVTIIAGSASPISAPELQSMAEQLDKMGTSKYGKLFDGGTLHDAADDLIDGLGDGCVSLESTRLDGVTDYIIVPANHLSMIRNFTSHSQRVPPAVPIILDRLRQDRSAAAGEGG